MWNALKRLFGGGGEPPAPVEEAWTPVNLKRRLPWIPTGEPYFLPASAEERLQEDLERAGFTVFTLDGALIHDAESLHQQLKRELEFPDYYGRNFHAFLDSLSDIDAVADGPVAIIWPESDRLANADIQEFASLVCMFFWAAARIHGQIEYFFLGEWNLPPAKRVALPTA